MGTWNSFGRVCLQSPFSISGLPLRVPAEALSYSSLLSSSHSQLHPVPPFMWTVQLPYPQTSPLPGMVTPRPALVPKKTDLGGRVVRVGK